MPRQITFTVLAVFAAALIIRGGASLDRTAAQTSTPARGRGDAAQGKTGGEHTQHGREVMRAGAEIRGDKVTGEAEFVEREHEGGQRVVHVTVRLKGDPSVLTPGLHGLHLHEKGVCEAPFTSAGGHFDPGPSSNPDPDVNHPFHMGDLPNISIDAKGVGTLEAVTTRVTLSDGPLSLFDADGSAIIIHGKQDQMTSGPPKSGVSGGPRVACGVIRRS